MKLIRILSYALCAVMLFAALAACQPSTGSDTTDAKGTEAVDDGTTQPAATTEEPAQTVEPYDPALDDSAVAKDEDDNVINLGTNVQSSTWVGTDGLGRELLTNADVGDVRQDKYVGIFYWTWHGTFASSTGVYNNQEIIDKYPDIDKNNYNDSRWGAGGYHFWNQPLFGYYSGNDTWVIRKHAEMLADAGIDVVFCDNTNGSYTWINTALKVMKVFSEARADGVNAPAVSFLLPFGADGGTDHKTATQLKELYSKIYSQELYKDVWFYWEEKPLLLAYGKESLSSSDATEKEIKNFFTWRPGQPAYAGSDKTINKWGWLSIYPQDTYFANSKDRRNGAVEEMSVGVAQNSSTSTLCTAMNADNVFGRSYTHADGFAHYKEENSYLYGYNFAEQFEYALQVDPKLIFITGWNEWVAIRQQTWGGISNAFADQYNDEYSRDIEPSAGNLKDHYYYQMINFIRRFKGVEKVPEASGSKYIDITAGYGQWANVEPAYYSYSGNTTRRMAAGYLDAATGSAIRYVSNTGRNDLFDCKVAQDSKNVYFMVRCVDDITPYTDPQWMRLYLDVSDSTSSWETYEYILNRTSPTSAASATLEAFTGTGFETTEVGQVEYSVSGNVMMVKIPRSMLGIGSGEFTVNFKWADNTQVDGDILDFYQTGDAAPGGRFKYQYNSK